MDHNSLLYFGQVYFGCVAGLGRTNASLCKKPNRVKTITHMLTFTSDSIATPTENKTGGLDSQHVTTTATTTSTSTTRAPQKTTTTSSVQHQEPSIPSTGNTQQPAATAQGTGRGNEWFKSTCHRPQTRKQLRRYSFWYKKGSKVKQCIVCFFS